MGSTTQALTIGIPGHSFNLFQCATEGGVCPAQFKYIAFGANGHFLFQSSRRDFLPCTRAAFGGDPIPGVVKACFASVYQVVTSENTSFTTGSQPRDVAYGANGVFNFRTISGPYNCNNATFGDPLKGVVKSCLESLTDYPVTAFEGGMFSHLVNTPVAFGANGRFVFKVLSGFPTCSVATFGSDPAPNVLKACYGYTFPRIADEGQQFNISGNRIVEYGSGLNGNFITKSFAIGDDCVNTVFGGDPDVGLTKHCYDGGGVLP